jgi:TonB family protein
MPIKPYPAQAAFGLLPEPERNAGSFLLSIAINGLILALMLYLAATARKSIDQHTFQETILILPAKPPAPQPKVKVPPPPPLKEQPKIEPVKFEEPKINLPRPEPKPALKPIQMENRLPAPSFRAARPSVILAPQPKSALAAAAMPAQVPQARPSTAPVHLGQTFGVMPNPNASRPATVAAIGNPYGGMRGPSAAPHGIVGSTGFGNGTRFGSNAGVVGRVASAGVAGAVTAPRWVNGRTVASAVIPSSPVTVAAARNASYKTAFTNLEVLSKPPIEYTSEARQLGVQGDVILRVTFTANGQVVVRSVVHGLGYGLDQEAQRVAQRIRFRPATRNGQAVDLTTNITITFQLA